MSELVTLVAYEEGVTKPSVVYWNSADAMYAVGGEDGHDHTAGRLFLPSPTWAKEYDPEVFGEGRYGLVILHELAHHIAWIRRQEEGHTRFMYAKLFQLCVRHGVDLVFAYENETGYLPREAKRGWSLFTAWAQA